MDCGGSHESAILLPQIKCLVPASVFVRAEEGV
jgi:hypothetical protein